MSRKTVPILLASIGALFIALVVIIVLQLAGGERGAVAQQRRNAVRTLLSRGGEYSLSEVAASVVRPLERGGSLDNLTHYLDKDPGRGSFAGSTDRDRAEAYLEGMDMDSMPVLDNPDVPGWVPGYISSVSHLFGEVKADVLGITGYPREMTILHPASTGNDSSVLRMEKALERFSETWIPSGQTRSSYRTDRKTIRDWLLGNRRFRNRLTLVDDSWKTLAASLYNLSVDDRWKTAAAYAPVLDAELDELIVVVLTADIHRRAGDMMRLVEDADAEPGIQVSPGIVWSPEFSYYKNIPELTGYTADVEETIFFAKVSLMYTFRDSRTQTWVNRRKDWLSDYFQSFFSGTASRDFSPDNAADRARTEWVSARMKAEAIHGINRKIITEMPFGKKKVYGIRDLALVRVNLLPNP